MLGALVIMAFVAFGSILVNHFIIKSKIDTVAAIVAFAFIAGALMVLIEMRGTLGKRIRSRVGRSKKARRKKKR
jgi:hypothetical protein